jgi:hypothetical protein
MEILMRAELRKHKRYPGYDKLFASIGADCDRVGRVENISLGGAAIICTGHLKEMETDTSIDLFLEYNGFKVRGIDCRLVYEKVMEWEVYHADPSEYSCRRCGIQFKTLTQEQETQLKKLIHIQPESPAIH